jgi:SAM-dependent methyltransferase
MLDYVLTRDPQARLTGTDFALSPLIALKQKIAGVTVVCADAASQVFRVCSFDRVVSLQVIQQIPSAEERQKAFRSIRAALKPGGRFVVTVLNRPWWRSLVANGKEGPLRSSPELYVYLYDPQELRLELISAGFSVERMLAINNLSVSYLKCLGWAGVWIDRLISIYLGRLSFQKGRYYCAICLKK